MAKTAVSLARTSDRQKWAKILSWLETILQNERSQIETLVGERKLLETYIQKQHEHWCSKTRVLRSHISNMKKTEELERKAQNARLEALLGLKDRDVSFFKDQLEQSERDLIDFSECIQALGKENMGLNEESKMIENSKQRKQGIVNLQTEMKKLKDAHGNIVSKKDSEISALFAEKDFIWNQFNKLDNDYMNLRNSKKVELEQAYEAIEKLQSTIEGLQSSATQKDETISKLRDDVADRDSELRRCTDEAKEKLAKVQKEVKELRKSVDEKNEIIAYLKKHPNLETTDAKPKRSSSRHLKVVNSTPLLRKHREVSSSKRNLPKQSYTFTVSDSSCTRSEATVIKRCSNKKKFSSSSSEDQCPQLFSAKFSIPKLKTSSKFVEGHGDI